jgi:hypothetical protein
MRLLVIIWLCFLWIPSAWPASFYTQRLNDLKAVYVAPSGADDTAAIQAAINQVQEKSGQGVVLLATRRYQISNTIYVWPGIRLIGYGAERPVIELPAATAGFGDAAHEKVMIFFAGRRPRNRQGSNGAVPDATPGTFYSALANIDIEVGESNSGAVAVRARYAQHCFIAHSDFRLGSALAGIHEGGNVVEDVHFFGGTHAVWTSKPSPGWQFTFIDCSFEDQREAAIFEHEAGLTLIRPHFWKVPTAVEIETNWVDELWIKDALLENISGPAFIFGMEKNPRNEITMEGVACRDVPVFAALTDSGKKFETPSQIYYVTNFSHGARFAKSATEPEIQTHFDAKPRSSMPTSVASDIVPLPDCSTWVNLRDLGAKGDGESDDTDALKKAIAANRTIYIPEGFYIVHDTLKLRPDSVLIGLHPGATQIILPDGTTGFQGLGEPKALLEAPKGGSNVVIGIGLYTSGNNRRAVAALWKAGASSMMNDVRFLGGHGTPKPDDSRENPYNSNHSGDPDPDRHWDSQYPSLWVTDGGGGTFLDIWTPSTFAQAGMRVSDTETEGRAYQISSEHHVRNEIQVMRAANWRFYALQTEEERGESGFALPIEVDSSHDITFANFHSYRVISSFQPFPYAVKISNSRDIHFRNFHCDSNSKVSFDSSISSQPGNLDIRKHEFTWLDVSDTPAKPSKSKVEKLAGGFFNISGGAVGPHGDFYFVDAHWQRIYKWDASARELSIVSDYAGEPVNLVADESANLIVISYANDGGVYGLDSRGKFIPLKSEVVAERPGKTLFLPVSDWRLNRNSLSQPAAQFVSPDGTAILPIGNDFLDGAVSWGVKSSPEIRSFALGKAEPGKPFYVTSESELRTWAADVNLDGSLKNFRLFAEEGGEGVTSDGKGNVYIAAGQIEVFSHGGIYLDSIEVPERPLQVACGGPDGKTLFICGRSALYSTRLK